MKYITAFLFLISLVVVVYVARPYFAEQASFLPSYESDLSPSLSPTNSIDQMYPPTSGSSESAIPQPSNLTENNGKKKPIACLTDADCASRFYYCPDKEEKFCRFTCVSGFCVSTAH